MKTQQQTQAASALDDHRVADHFRNRYGANAYVEAEKTLPAGRRETKRVLALLK